VAIRKLQHGYTYEGHGREEKRESQSPQGLEAASPLRPQVQRHPKNKPIKIQHSIVLLIFDRAVVCPEAISKLPNGSFDRLMTLSNIEGPISMRPAVLLKVSFSLKAAFQLKDNFSRTA
jgi:hypothetical protein